ncbi:Holliday junction ATP-dependent DNA helicase RuvB [Candidatus Tachikawaea gelatinosa]|uniref:Holliday junction ATP-dependent DNA helicase RuvB n=1 Tax=Candidatus Tachikawaea gelatinosa TaxID=1410383 RepID=A0A090AQU2_9ENTR|nr:Holliday junction ATP-dependent DNA helicase RuvB [Candidatus Tachikawaea gelatinosa]
MAEPLNDRFGIFQKLGFYSAINLKKILLKNTSILDIETDKKSVLNFACITKIN